MDWLTCCRCQSLAYLQAFIQINMTGPNFYQFPWCFRAWLLLPVASLMISMSLLLWGSFLELFVLLMHRLVWVWLETFLWIIRGVRLMLCLVLVFIGDLGWGDLAISLLIWLDGGKLILYVEDLVFWLEF